MTDDRYNYAIFPPDDDVDFFAGFAEHLKPGDHAPDGQLHDLGSGGLIRLSDISRDAALTVIELGSFT